MKTILQVEDDVNDVFFMQRAMKKAGATNPIQVVSDGQEAIDYLQGAGKFADRQKFPFPYLVLLDLKLPYVMGLDVLRWIRQQPPTPMVVIVLTASAEETDIAMAYRLGANGFMTKPCETRKFDDMVRSIKDFWLTHNTLPQEAYEERPSVPAYSRTIAPAVKHLPSAIGAHREEWHPMMSKEPYEKTRSVGLS
jgi:CheY-like chemotaxis protein